MKIKQEWFASWFDSPYYHTLYKDRDETEAQQFIERLLKHLKPQENSQALDLACGKGRHSLVLANNGLNVLGADLSPASINAAKELENERLKFIVQDMREPTWNNRFDYIFNLFTSFGYFERFVDNLRTINAVHAGLKENGIFVIDFLNAIKTVNELVPKSEKEIDGIHFEIERAEEKGIIVKRIYVHDNGECKSFQERVQALTLEDFEAYFYNKFQIRRLFGDYELNEFNEQTSDRLIIVAQKRRC